MTPFSGVVWRILFADQGYHPTTPARAPEGRFHHDSQLAVYTSLTAKGAGTAIQRYLTPDDRPRVIVPLRVSAGKILDMRADQPADGTTPPTSVVWQDQRALAQRASTWDISDDARDQGAQGILYASRTHPELSHLVVLAPLVPGLLIVAGPAKSWP